MVSRPLAVWGAKIPKDQDVVPVVAEVPCDVRITMAAIDPTSAPSDPNGPPKFATLKIFRRPLGDMYDDEDDSEDDAEDNSEEEESEPEEEKSKNCGNKSDKKAANGDKMDIDEAKSPKGKQGDKKSVKGQGESEGDDEGDDEFDNFGGGMQGLIVCTLDNQRTYQQPLDITVGAEELVYFKVAGDFDVHITGNYIEYTAPRGNEDEEDYDTEEEDYNLSPSEDELYPYGEDTDDDLDDLEDPRIEEIQSDEEKEEKKATPKKERGNKKETAKPATVVSADKNAKKRSAEDEEKAFESKVANDEKLSKKERKRLRANNGKAVNASEQQTTSNKKVKFAMDLEQGPTLSSTEKLKASKPEPATKAEASKSEPAKPAPGSTVRKVQGVTIDDKTPGTGLTAKNGNKVLMRYIGKLATNGKVFDSNTKGKPFSFQLGKNEVIKGWEIGIMGIQKGGERRLTIPPELAYGKKAIPGIPANSTLVFDVKCLEIK